MKNIYFVQVDVSASSKTQNAYLPYTAGILVASAFTSEIVKSEYCFKEFIFLREDVDTVVSRMENPQVVGFSSYCWSTEYNKLLASRIKEKFPECLIVFGGHDVPDNFDMLEEYPFIDILCHGEGEDTVRELLEAYATGIGFENVCNISFRNTDGTYTRTPTKLQTTLDYPSPYIDGWFDRIVAENPDITFNAILETSRGCPNQCAYCDWGLLKAKTRMFPIERIREEIRWMSEHKIAFVWGADANFGLYERDLEIAEELVDAKKKNGYPERMRMNYAKNNYKNVFAIVEKFKECEFDRIGATLSFQSLSPVALKNIKRVNSSLDFYKNLLTEYNKKNMKTYSELILGLPGETYESFIKGIGTLFEIGQHFVFEVYGCILLPNAAMGQKDYIEEHGIKTVRSEIIRPHFNDDAFSVPEYNTIIVETNTMSREMWVKSTAFYYMVKALHGNGLVRAFAIYLFYEFGIPYEVFYDGIIGYFENNPDLFITKLYHDIKEKADELSLGITNRKLLFKPCGDIVWDDHEYVVLQVLAQLDRFYDEILPYLQSFNIPSDVFEDLLNYQRNIIRTPLNEEKTVTLKYDIHSYLKNIYINNYTQLEKRPHTLIMRDSDHISDWEKFGKFVVWYGRMGWSSYKDDITEK